jgi:hypothetical protein
VCYDVDVLSIVAEGAAAAAAAAAAAVFRMLLPLLLSSYALLLSSCAACHLQQLLEEPGMSLATAMPPAAAAAVGAAAAASACLKPAATASLADKARYIQVGQAPAAVLCGLPTGSMRHLLTLELHSSHSSHSSHSFFYSLISLPSHHSVQSASGLLKPLRPQPVAVSTSLVLRGLLAFSPPTRINRHAQPVELPHQALCHASQALVGLAESTMTRPPPSSLAALMTVTIDGS